ncbi:hypothetical protein [Negadavirga shengliensis]|uniref:Uncharacterized protein n=1 Tax=Negadavirga shengliensis TaxID=1389218 RepID=A0ABV9SXN1_9BACT
MSCESDYGIFNRDNRPEIPLVFVNATSHGFDPYVEVSESSGGSIEFTMEIPQNSGRSISEIRRVAAGGTAINPGTLNTDGDYIENAIAGSGNQVTFTTTVAEFREKRPNVAINIPAGGYAEIAFIFEVILDNGESIISMRSRARVFE